MLFGFRSKQSTQSSKTSENNPSTPSSIDKRFNTRNNSTNHNPAHLKRSSSLCEKKTSTTPVSQPAVPKNLNLCTYTTNPSSRPTLQPVTNRAQSSRSITEDRRKPPDAPPRLESIQFNRLSASSLLAIATGTENDAKLSTRMDQSQPSLSVDQRARPRPRPPGPGLTFPRAQSLHSTSANTLSGSSRLAASSSLALGDEFNLQEVIHQVISPLEQSTTPASNSLSTYLSSSSSSSLKPKTSRKQSLNFSQLRPLPTNSEISISDLSHQTHYNRSASASNSQPRTLIPVRKSSISSVNSNLPSPKPRTSLSSIGDTCSAFPVPPRPRQLRSHSASTDNNPRSFKFPASSDSINPISKPITYIPGVAVPRPTGSRSSQIPRSISYHQVTSQSPAIVSREQKDRLKHIRSNESLGPQGSRPQRFPQSQRLGHDEKEELSGKSSSDPTACPSTSKPISHEIGSNRPTVSFQKPQAQLNHKYSTSHSLSISRSETGSSTPNNELGSDLSQAHLQSQSQKPHLSRNPSSGPVDESFSSSFKALEDQPKRLSSYSRTSQVLPSDMIQSKSFVDGLVGCLEKVIGIDWLNSWNIDLDALRSASLVAVNGPLRVSSPSSRPSLDSYVATSKKSIGSTLLGRLVRKKSKQRPLQTSFNSNNDSQTSLAFGSGGPVKKNLVFGQPIESSGPFSCLTIIGDQQHLIPLVVFSTIEELFRRGMKTPGLMKNLGNSTRIKQLSRDFSQSPEFGEGLDVGQEDIHVLAGLLKRYLRSLPEPVMKRAHFEVIWRSCLDRSSRLNLKLEDKILVVQCVMRLMNPRGYSLLIYVVAFLSQIPLFEENQLDTAGLVKIFGPPLLSYRIMTDLAQELEEDQRSREVLHWIINHWNAITVGLLDLQLLMSGKVTSPKSLSSDHEVSSSAASIEDMIGIARTTSIIGVDEKTNRSLTLVPYQRPHTHKILSKTHTAPVGENDEGDEPKGDRLKQTRESLLSFVSPEVSSLALHKVNLDVDPFDQKKLAALALSNNLEQLERERNCLEVIDEGSKFGNKFNASNERWNSVNDFKGEMVKDGEYKDGNLVSDDQSIKSLQPRRESLEGAALAQKSQENETPVVMTVKLIKLDELEQVDKLSDESNHIVDKVNKNDGLNHRRAGE
ncbi:hypothetical protein BY996DRAFT_6412100 [Phakopsora pachyrhizi]|nr:hypothetical protein BY996DRAFT_6412100 [Phakopsora pachyrhizi]